MPAAVSNIDHFPLKKISHRYSISKYHGFMYVCTPLEKGRTPKTSSEMRGHLGWGQCWYPQKRAPFLCYQKIFKPSPRAPKPFHRKGDDSKSFKKKKKTVWCQGKRSGMNWGCLLPDCGRRRICVEGPPLWKPEGEDGRDWPEQNQERWRQFPQQTSWRVNCLCKMSKIFMMLGRKHKKGVRSDRTSGVGAIIPLLCGLFGKGTRGARWKR